MKTESVDVKEAQSQFKDLVGRVAEGVRFILRQNGKPVAQLAPLTLRVAGLHAGSIWTSDDFDAPLPDELWTSEQ